MPTPEFRDMNNHRPFELPVKVIPMLLVNDLEKKHLIVEMKVYFFEEEFNSDRESNFKLLSDKAIFSAEQYEAVKEAFSEQFALLETTARTAANFLENDELKTLKIDSEENIVEIRGEREINGAVDLAGDPSVVFGPSQNKFELLKQQYPELVAMYYQLVLSIFATKTGEKQKFFQAVFQHFLANPN